MEHVEKKNLESIKQELITISQLISYLTENMPSIKNLPIKKYIENMKIRDKNANEIMTLRKRQKRLQHERRYYLKHNRFPNEKTK